MNTILLVFTAITSAFLVEICQADGKQEQQSDLNCVKYVPSTPSATVSVGTETGGQMPAVVCHCVRLRKRDSERARDPRRDAQILQQKKSSANQQNCELRQPAAFFIVIRSRKMRWAEHVTRMPSVRHAYIVLAGKRVGKWTLQMLG
jgi:hypothetical protein